MFDSFYLFAKIDYENQSNFGDSRWDLFISCILRFLKNLRLAWF